MPWPQSISQWLLRPWGMEIRAGFGEREGAGGIGQDGYVLAQRPVLQKTEHITRYHPDTDRVQHL